MPEQLGNLGGRRVWGTPNVDEDGRLLRPSNCRHCVHWTRDDCAIRYSPLFPDVTDCRAYAREPGSDDQ